MAASAVTGYAAYSRSGMSDLMYANIEALTHDETLNGGESSSGWITCYSSYNSCWFWNCWKIYRCGDPCYEVKCDKKEDSDKCLLF